MPARFPAGWRAKARHVTRALRVPPLPPRRQAVVAENDYVIVHGRFSGIGRPRNWIAADVVRVANGVLAEHWDVLQDEATKAESQSGLPMFGTTFPE
jgi:predicted SnoaL-like aldol condensation-catalyzing enzyme